MRVSTKWLRDYIDITTSPAELANRLMMAGNEVKAVETIGASWDNVIIGKVAAINPHPNADRLRLITVDTGKGQETVVCGAFNFATGDKIVFASVGAELSDGHTGQRISLKPAKIRGVESKGMICSEMELGISQDHTGIMVLPPDAPVGTLLRDYLGDTIIDFDITPNRPDCLSIIGIARESAALTGQTVHLPDVNYSEIDTSVESKITVEIQAADLCPRYCASLITDIKIMPSPKWMQDRLIASGMRPINNIVDISNYVMLEYGQPLHTFDYDKLSNQKIIVRRANDNEIIISLDGVERKLNSGMLVIADTARAIAVAGVMGGANSEVTEQTKNILLEAASFKSTSIHSTGEALGLPSESRYRFERGIATNLTLPALKRATQLIAELGAGKVARGWIDVYPGKIPNQLIKLSQTKLQRLLGTEYSIEKIVDTLSSLGFTVKKMESPTQIEVIAPYWRSDIHIEADLIEEVARITGYDKIPNTLLAEPLPHMNPDPIFNFKRDLRVNLSATGFTEVMNFSLIGLETLNKISPEPREQDSLALKVANPMTFDMEYLRTSFRPNLLTAFSDNRKHEDSGIRIFETGKVYLPRKNEQPDERETVCAVMGGSRYEKSWQDNNQVLDFFDIKGLAESLLARFGIIPRFEKGQDLGLHPNKQADIYLEDQKIGAIGEIHPKVLQNFDINEPVYLLELDLKATVPFTMISKEYLPIPRFPSILRDMALLVDINVTHQKIQKIIQEFNLIERVEIFDVYSGEQVPAGKKSLAYRVSFRSPTHTLTEEEVNQVQQQILSRLSGEVGAALRS